MLWSQIVDRASVPFEPSDETKIKAKKYGEEAQQDFAFHTKSYERTRGIYIDNDDREIALPDDFIEMAGYVEFRNRVLGLYPEHRRYPRRTSANVYRTGTPENYEIKGSNMYLYPSPSTVGVLQFQYTATINNLEDSATAYKRLNYTSLISGYWAVGKNIQGLTSNATATIEEDINDNNTGTLVLSNVSGTFTPAETIVQLDEEQAMNLLEQESWG